MVEDEPDMPIQRLIHIVKGLRLTTEDSPERQFMGYPEVREIARAMWTGDQVVKNEVRSVYGVSVNFTKGVVEARDPSEAPGVEALRAAILQEFRDVVFRTSLPSEAPPIRGPTVRQK